MARRHFCAPGARRPGGCRLKMSPVPAGHRGQAAGRGGSQGPVERCPHGVRRGICLSGSVMVAVPVSCPAVIRLPESLVSWILCNRPGTPFHDVQWCELDHGPGNMHAALVSCDDSGGVWVQWMSTLTIWRESPYCSSGHGSGMEREFCRLYSGHPGRHGFGSPGCGPLTE